ncbi:hypothetical protein BKA70DRAFT_1432171 [Coprinopsis sp. MPI-PUGE-AT-0042]|nr:hypothetical protein BKA70DRAFT_1432171 [Coprinopsis sp. MPI-PUGE-AT-0042]
MARVRLWRRGTKHYLPKLNHSKANPYPLAANPSAYIAAQPSQTSAQLIQNLPAEIVSEIARDVLADTIFWHEAIRSWNYTFIPIRQVLKHSLAQVCRSWRTIALQFILSSRQNRQGIYIATTLQELLTVQEWLPDAEIRGCLLLLGSPNDLLLGPTDDMDNISIVAAQGSALHAIEAVEWLEASTAGFSYVGDPPDIDSASKKLCQVYAKVDGSEGDHEENARLLCEAIVVVSYEACAKVLDLLSLLPHLKAAEVPVWVIMLAALTDATLTSDQQNTIMGSLGGEVVTGAALRGKLLALLPRLERLHIVGYSFGPFGVFPSRTEGTWLEEYVGGIPSTMERRLRERFMQARAIEIEKALPQGSLDHLKGLAWRDNPLDEVVEYDHLALEMILNYRAHFQLEEFFAINKDDAKKQVAPTVPFPYLYAPVFSRSANTLRKLTLYLTFGTTASSEDDPPNHCTFISAFSELLPAIEYVDISVPALCKHAFDGHFKPAKPIGAFKLTIVFEVRFCQCSSGTVMFHAATWSAKALLRLLKVAQPHFAEAEGWDVQVRLSAPDNPSRVPGKFFL